MSKSVTFLDNPPRGAKKKRAAKKSARKSGKRPPPKGWSSWKAFMGHLRNMKGGGGKKRHAVARPNPSTSRGTSMAGKKKGGGSRAHKKTKKTYKRRSNPPMFGKLARFAGGNGPVGFAIGTLGRSFVGLGGEVSVRKVRGLAKQAPGTLMGSVIEGVTALLGGFLISRVHLEAGKAFAQGGLSAPIRTFVQNRGIPHISDSLGDDGYLMGPGTGVTLISAYPQDYSDVVQGEDGEESLGRYVSGATAGDAMQGYVAGQINAAG